MENQNLTPPVSEVPNPTTPVSDTPPVIPESPNTVIPGLTRNPETPKKFPLKLVIGIIIFLLLAGGAAASYVYKDQLVSMVAKPTPSPTVIPGMTRNPVSPTPSPNPTADWQTYSSSQYEFSFQFPPKYTIQSEDTKSIIFSKIDELTGKKIESFLTLNFKSTLAAGDWKHCAELKQHLQEGQKCVLWGPNEIDNPNGIRYRQFEIDEIQNGEEKFNHFFQLIEKPEIEFNVQYSNEADEYVIGLILSTFNFTK